MNIKVTFLRKEKAFIRGDKVVNQDDCVKEFNSIEDAKKVEIPAGYSVAFFFDADQNGYFIRLIDSEWVFSSINKSALGNKSKRPSLEEFYAERKKLPHSYWENLPQIQPSMPTEPDKSNSNKPPQSNKKELK